MNPKTRIHVSASRNAQARFRLLSFTASRVGKLAACLILSVSTLSQTARSAESYGAKVLTENPVAFWQLNETSDPSTGILTAVDSSPNGLNGTYGTASQNAFNYIQAPQDPPYAGFTNGQGALRCFASEINSAVTVPALNLNTNAVTIAMWINPADVIGTYTGLLMNRNPAGDAEGFGFGGNTSSSMAELGYTWNTNSGSTWGYHSGLYPVVGTWQFVALVIQSNSATFYLYYVDPNTGQPVLKSAVNSIAHDPAAFSDGLTLLGDDIVNGNAGDSSRVFNGSISGAAVFKSALTSDQVLSLFAAGLGVQGFAPQIAGQPQSKKVYPGLTTQLSATGVSGSAPLAYQWQLNGTNVNELADNANFTGANSNILTVLSMATADAGSYQLIVTNVVGMAVSSNATLTVLATPSPSLVGQWLNGSASLADASGYSPAGTHDAFAIGGTPIVDYTTNIVYTTNIDVVNDITNIVSDTNLVAIATNYLSNYAFVSDVPFGKTGQSLLFTTNDTGLAISNSSTVDANYTNTFDEPINGAITVACWAKGVPSAWNPFVSKFGENWGTDNNGGWQMRSGTYSNTPCWTVRDNGAGSITMGWKPSWDSMDDLHSSVTLDDGGWHFLVGTYTAATGIRDLYVDGLLAAQETGNEPYVLAAAAHLCIGAKGDLTGGGFGGYFTGNLYDVRVYNYALSLPQVQAVMGVIPPAVSVQPKSTTTFVGRTAQMSATVAGTDPLACQWKLNGTNVNLLADSANFTGANSNILTILSASLADAGVYQLTVANDYGSTVSSNATLTVVPKLLLGHWFAGATNLNDISGYTPTNTHDAYAVGSGTYAFASDVPSGYSGQSVSLDGNGGFAIANSSTADGSYTNTFDASIFTVTFWAKGRGNWTAWDQWVSKNGDDGLGWMIGTVAWSRNLEYTMRGIDKGGITVTKGEGLWGTEILDVPNDSISDTAWYLYAATYNASSGIRSLYRNGALVAQETGNAQYTLAPDQHLSIGCEERASGFTAFNATKMFDVRVYNYDLTAAEIQVMTNLPNPAIMSQPQSATIYAGQTKQFNVSVSGTASITNHWQFNGVNLVDGNYGGVIITGSTSNVLTIANISASYQGSYQLVVSNSNGKAISDYANLTVLSTVAPPAGNLVGEWLAGPASFADTSGHSLAGTHNAYGVRANNLPATNYVFTSDVPTQATGQSLTLNGNTVLAVANSSTVDAGYVNTFDATINNMTVAFWAKGLPGGWSPFVSKYGEGSLGWQLRIGNPDATPCWTVRDGGVGSYTLGNGPSWAMTGDLDDMHSSSTVDTGWHFYAGTFDGTTGIRNLYVDGTLKAQENGNVPYGLASGAHVAIGGRDDSAGNNFGSYYTGKIYGVRIYNTALTEAQVNYLISTPPPATVTPPSVPSFTGTPVVNGNQMVLTWTVGSLLQATNVVGPWMPTVAISPYTNNISTNPQMFYKLSNP